MRVKNVSFLLDARENIWNTYPSTSICLKEKQRHHWVKKRRAFLKVVLPRMFTSCHPRHEPGVVMREFHHGNLSDVTFWGDHSILVLILDLPRDWMRVGPKNRIITVRSSKIFSLESIRNFLAYAWATVEMFSRKKYGNICTL